MFTLPGNRIYHYCQLNTAIEKILPKKELLLSPLNKTNDPRENKSFIFSSISDWETTIPYDNAAMFQMSNILREDCKTISFSTDSDLFGYEYSRLWAHYGDRHKGVCLELDRETFINENKQTIQPELFKLIKYEKLDISKIFGNHKLVNWTQMEQIGMEKYLQEHFRYQELDYLYFTKSDEWSSEREMRLLYFSKKKEEEFCKIEKSLKNIFVGVDFEIANLSAIKSITNVDISKLSFIDGRMTPKEI